MHSLKSILLYWNSICRSYFVDEDVLWLQVSVEDIQGVAKSQPLQQLVVKRL